MAKKKQSKRSVSRVVSKNPPPLFSPENFGPPVEKKDSIVELSAAVSPDAGSKIAPLLITQRDLCGLLNVSRSTLVRMGDSAIPGRVMVGGSIRYHKATVEAWLLSKVDAVQTHNKED